MKAYKDQLVEEWYYVGGIVILNFVISTFLLGLNKCRRVTFFPGSSNFRAVVIHEILNMGVVLFITSAFKMSDVDVSVNGLIS
jgi:hypothetical protein